MKVVSIFGTRPEMIKMWSTLKKLDALNFQHIMVHTGQNFTPELKIPEKEILQLRREILAGMNHDVLEIQRVKFLER